jgi:hypothetical protein
MVSLLLNFWNIYNIQEQKQYIWQTSVKKKKKKTKVGDTLHKSVHKYFYYFWKLSEFVRKKVCPAIKSSQAIIRVDDGGTPSLQTYVYNSIMTWMYTWEDLIAFICCESLKSYKVYSVEGRELLILNN